MNTNEVQSANQPDTKQTGKVKWFNNEKGYVFILPDSGEPELFAHFSSILSKGFRSLSAGQAVEFHTKPTDKGFHAIDITVMDKLDRPVVKS